MLLSKRKRVTLLPIPENMWINYIHGRISSYCISEKKLPVSINMLEKVLFLTQYESIKNESEPFYEYETYVQDGGIRIKYLSDRLRVMSMRDATAESTSEGYLNYEVMNKYMKSIEDMLNASEVELTLRVEEIIQQKKLNEKYFKFNKYSNSFARKQARVSARNLSSKFILFIIKRFFGLIGYFCVLMFIVSLIISLFNSKVPLAAESFEIALWSAPCLILWIIWHRKWMKPTKYEVDNNYVND